MLRSRWFLVVCILAATSVLLALGVWQVRRLEWKEALIARVEARLGEPALPLVEMIGQWRASRDVDYRPVEFAGVFDHAREVHLYTTHRGAVGWNVYTPIALDGGGWLIVNRGFVPDAMRDPGSRETGQVAGRVELAGLARDPVVDKPNPFVPDNRPEEREFYWKSFPAMAAAMRLEAEAGLVPFFVDSGPSQVVGAYPLGGTTLVEFPNNHLQYAVTWFGLALACLGVGFYFLLSGGRRAAGGGGGA